MIPLSLPSDRFTTERGYFLRVEVPAQNLQQMVEALNSATDLKYGDYDQVTFTSAPGVQRFRSLGGGHNPRKDAVSQWECSEVTFFLPDDDELLEGVLRAIYAMHPSEEPVIQIIPAIRPLHVRGVDENNPNRFWNRADSVKEL